MLLKRKKRTALRSFQITVLRKRRGESASFRQTFLYAGESEGDTVATALLRLNARPDLSDISGERTTPVVWENSCLQKRCGACAMLINGEPRLACDTRLRDLPDEISLAPLRKFPVIEDLLTDRRIMQRNLREIGVYMETEARPEEKRLFALYDASRCLQCGLCLEVCPNYSADSGFTGAAAAVPSARVLLAERQPADSALASAYRKRVFEGCGKSLACEAVCPAGIPVGEMLSRSNAAAVWGRNHGI